ncbi:hypothetical protein PBRA_009601 [Plasmodiophora brassicae]|uniref:Integrase catalytic domain-containing protein n=1 Tax=Plasmodiophora brassicae TaxID=37360 RepID=A0A0G4IIU5_PLABS|nr:hypothetical protein PBRA_009601 [Plasmodiophora brassicae]
MASETTSSTDEHIGVKDADVSILPRSRMVIDREGNRPDAARIKPQAIRFCFTTPQLTCIALNHLFLNNVDLLIDSQIKKLPASHGLTTQDIEAKIANETVDDLLRVVLEGIRVPYELDSGCRGGNIMPGHIAVQLKKATFRDVQQRDVTSAEGKGIGTITRTVQVPATSLETEVGNLTLYLVTYYVCDEIPVILFGDNLLTTLGINPRQQLENIIASGCTEMDTLSGCAAVDVDCIETDATPYRCKPRFYNPKQKEFLDDMISMLKENGLVYMNMNSQWASPVLVVKKPKGDGYLQLHDGRRSIFDDMKENLLIWIDDILGFARSEEDLLHQLTRELERCRERNLKKNPNKCTLFARELKWCGRIYSREGVRHDPERIEALTSMPRPKTANDLQQFLSAANWMRTHVPGYASIVRPLQELLDIVNEELKRIRSSSPSCVSLDALGWSDQQSKSFEDVLFALIQHIQLAFPKEDHQTCLFTDASDAAWSAVVTQIPMEDVNLPVCEQRHEPLAFYGKRFSGAEIRWPTIEKEAAAIINATQRGDFLLQTSREFLLYCDHRNLTFIFDRNSEIKKHTAQKLERWALHLQGFSLKMKEIAGTDNEIRDSQRFLSREEKIVDGVYFDEADRLWKNESKAVLIPRVYAFESWSLAIGQALVIVRRKGADHKYKYILLLKDDFSGYVRLIPSAEATSRVAAEALNQWIADFATPEYLVTDGGSHFTAEVMEELTRLRDVQHHITTAYFLNEAQISTHNWPY